jgi:PGF-CTERM protein
MKGLRLGLVIVLLITLTGVASAATVTLDVSAENVTYGDTFQVTVTYTGEGYLRILDSSYEVVWSTALSGSGHDVYTIGTTDLLYPGTYTIEAYVEDASGANATDSKIINVTSPTPIISIKMENEGGKVAAGDLAKFEISVYGASSAKYTITGPYGNVSDILTLGENEVVFNTSEVITPSGEVATGVFEIVVTADGYEKRLSFTVEPIKLFIDMPSEIRAGSLVTLAGSTNIANTNSEFDTSTPNKVKLSIRAGSEDGEEIWNGTAYVVTRRYEFSIRIPLDAEGTYYAVFEAETAPNATKSVTQMFEVFKPKIDIVADRTLVRGEEVEIRVETSLPAGTGIALEAPSGLFEGVSSVILSTDAAGVAKTTLRVSEDAALGTYEVRAYVVARPDVSDSALFRVVLQNLDVSADTTKVVRGGIIHLNGTTTVNRVYVYADSEVFEGVARLPSLNLPFSVEDYPTKAVMVNNDTFSISLKISEYARDDEYTLYVFAPSSDVINPVSDPMKVITVIVEDPDFTNVSYKEKLPRAQDIVVRGKTNSPIPDETLVKFRLKGPNVRYSGYAGVESDGSFEIRIDPFLGEEPTPNNMITTGLYTIELTLVYFGEEVDSSERLITFQIVNPEISVDVQDIVKVGEKLKIKITTNRDEDYQSPLYVVMEGANRISVYQIAVKAGNSVVEIDTSKLWPGNYTIYVRDIMRTTVGSPFEYYDISPNTVYARYYDAQDDVLVVKKVKIIPADAHAEISVKSINVTPEVLYTGTEAEIEVVVENTGLLAGNVSINVSVDGETIDTIHAELDAGAKKTFTIKHVFGKGTHVISAGDLKKVVVVSELPKPLIEVERIIVPDKVSAGNVTVDVVVVNKGDAEGSKEIELYLNDELVASKTVTVDAHALETVKFEITVKPGVYTLKAGNATASLTVTAPTPITTPTPIETSKKKKLPFTIPGFEAVFALAGLAGTAYLLRRR